MGLSQIFGAKTRWRRGVGPVGMVGAAVCIICGCWVVDVLAAEKLLRNQAAREHANQMRMKDAQQRLERREEKVKEKLAGQSAVLGQMMFVFDCIPAGLKINVIL